MSSASRLTVVSTSCSTCSLSTRLSFSGAASYHDLRRISLEYNVRRKTPIHQTVRDHDRVIADDRSIQNGAVRPDPDISTDSHSDRKKTLLLERHIQRGVAIVTADDCDIGSANDVIAELDPATARGHEAPGGKTAVATSPQHAFRSLDLRKRADRVSDTQPQVRQFDFRPP